MVKLIPMKKATYSDNIELAKKLYSNELQKYGEVQLADKAFSTANTEINTLLNYGYNTPNNYFMDIISDGVTVGFLWFRVQETESVISAHLCFIYIKPECRKKHYGEDALQRLINHLGDLSIGTLTLLVFIHNTAAVKLYEKLGFEVSKHISLHDAEPDTRYQMALNI